MPIFLLVGLGAFLKKIDIINDAFTEKANNLVFRVALPTMVFLDIATINITEEFDGKLVLVAVLITVIMFFVALFASGSVKDRKIRASFAQGIFRSNYAILGVPLTKALFSPEIAVNASVLLAICVPVYNVLAVVLLTRFLSSEGGISKTLKGIAKNPIIIGAALGVIVSLLKISLPVVIMKPLEYIGQMCVPLSLIVIGGSFVLSKAKKTMKLAVIASVIKTLLTPLVFIFPAWLVGIEGAKLGVMYLFLATPAAISSYTMARNMGGDYHLAGNIVIISTAMCFFTIFSGMMVMKTMGIF